MTTTQFGTKIPDNSTEFWELYNTFEMKFIDMFDKVGNETSVPSYEVVEKLMSGWNLDNRLMINNDRQLSIFVNDTDEIPF